MNIAFDATAILGPMSKNRGIGNYALSQFRMMIKNDTENKYFLLNCFEPFSLFEDPKDAGLVHEEYFYAGKDRFLIQNEKYKAVFGQIVKEFIRKNDIDVFYITSPFESNCYLYDREWFADVKVVVTVYDIIPYVFRERYLADKTTYHWYMKCVDMLRWCDKLLVISESVKTDLINYLQFPPDKIECIWGAVDERYQVVPITESDKDYFRNKFGIQNKFIMCTGGDDDRKNIAGLIEAYSRIGDKLIKEYQLVIVCKLSKESEERYYGLSDKLGIKDRVVLTNFVSYEDLVKLYNMADLMAFPSQYEGFGLPVVEAFASGTAVLTSNNSSLVEIAGDAAYLVDPFSIQDIARGLKEALLDENRNVMAEKGFEQLKKFQWEVVADDAIRAINSLDFSGAEKEENTEKKKIAFFTPLPPVQSGISDYSVDILNGISKYFDVDVFVDSGYEPVCELQGNIKVYNHKRFDPKTKYFDIIYQMGNSEYHFYMYPYVKKYKGTVVLHDYNLHGAVQYKALFQEKDYDLYRNYLLEDYSTQRVDEYIGDLKAGKTSLAVYDMELNGFITNYANKIIVHSDEAREKLLKKDIARDVRTIRHYAAIEKLADAEKAKEKLGYKKEDVVFAAFGHMHTTKRVVPILKAFAKLCKEYDDAKFVFVGKLDEGIKKVFYDLVNSNRLGDKVKVTGYTELDEFIEYIDATDVCLNLRYPYNGETSGSLMRILAKGKCVLINDIGSFGEIPDGACVKLPNVETMVSEEAEVEFIYKEMRALLEEPEKRAAIGKAARKYAEENLDINIVCRQYAEYILQNRRNVLNEQLLREIRTNELLPKGYNDMEIGLLAKTLAYCKL